MRERIKCINLNHPRDCHSQALRHKLKGMFRILLIRFLFHLKQEDLILILRVMWAGNSQNSLWANQTYETFKLHNKLLTLIKFNWPRVEYIQPMQDSQKMNQSFTRAKEDSRVLPKWRECLNLGATSINPESRNIKDKDWAAQYMPHSLNQTSRISELRKANIAHQKVE